MKNSDMPAMPLPLGSETVVGQQGLTKREMFAMHMMAACRSRNTDYHSWADMAQDAIDMADALLEKLEQAK